MDKRHRIFSLIFALGIIVSIVIVAQAQTDNIPAITSFSTPLAGVDRNALASRTARISVRWTTSYH